MLSQNYLKVFINAAGTVTIASGIGDPKDFQTLDIESIAIDKDDLLTLANALIELSEELTDNEL